MKCFEFSKRIAAALVSGAALAAVSTAVSAMPVPWQLNMTPGVTKTDRKSTRLNSSH